MRQFAILLITIVSTVSAFQVSPIVSKVNVATPIPLSVMNAEDKKKRVGSSGYKQDRLNKLAEMESSRVETDKSFVLKAAGGFAGFIVIVIVAAFASGVLDQ